jgi:Holliday junction resolvase
MANRSKEKGSRFERQIVDTAKSFGLDAYRVPLSGSAVGFKDDIEIRLPDRSWNLEAKKRANGFKQIYDWLGDADGLVIAADRKQALIVIDLDEFLKLLIEISERKAA